MMGLAKKLITMVALRLALWCLLSPSSVVTKASEMRLAYVALASGPKWLLPARTLGKSIERTGSTIPRVMMLTYSPSDGDRALLEGEGWELRELPRLPNPYNDVGEMTRNTFSTTWIFNLTGYDKVLFIDSDFIVLRNLDHIFDCGVFCAVVSVRETQGRFNGGFMMATPDPALFDFMMHWRENGLHSYNQGAQGFYNEALPLWCSYGKVREWNEIRSGKGLKTKAWRKCMSLPEYYNHVAVAVNNGEMYKGTWFPPFEKVTNMYSQNVHALHFNNPVFWAIKPWKWIWYPVLPSNWFWWQARRQVPGEHEKAMLLLFRGVMLPIAFSIWFCISAKVFAGMTEWRGRLLQRIGCGRACSHLNLYLEVILVTVIGSTAAFLLLPAEGDALVAWASLFVMKGCWLGLFACQIASRELGIVVSSTGGDKTSHRQLRCWSVLRGYGCGLLECILVWFPQTQGLVWTSDRGLAPVCQNHSRHSEVAYRIWEIFGCNLFLLLLVIFIGVVAVLLEVCLLCPLWRGKLAKSGAQSTNDIELASAEKTS
mmetsp:Transcript_96918/g.211899  ORF Transcript_96918/g.211899 Transcript_96918/m.211899 type:complete len:541 (-) Transcript_96918:33-1655(-)